VFVKSRNYVHFLLVQKMNQKRAPEMTNSARTYACYTSFIGATVRAEFRAISGLPTHSHLQNTVNKDFVFWISTGLREFWERATVLKLAARACSKQYCLSECNERVVMRGQVEKQKPQNYLQP